MEETQSLMKLSQIFDMKMNFMENMEFTLPFLSYIEATYTL